MSYGKNPYQTGQQPPVAYPFGQYYPYQPAAPSGSSGATPYPTIPNGHTWPPPTGVTGYGAWPHAYSYIPGQQQQSHIQVQSGTAGVQPAASTSTPGGTQTPKTTTFSSYSPYYTRESTSGPSGGRAVRKQANFKGMFSKELKNLMYGFGDDRNPGNDTVNVMEEILIEFITDVCQTAAGPTKKTRLSVDDLRRALSRPADAKKLARMEELLFMQEDIKRARAQFDESEEGQSKAF